MTDTGTRRQATEPETAGTAVPRPAAPLSAATLGGEGVATTRTGRARNLVPPLLALAVWAAGTAVAMIVVRMADQDPMTLRGHLGPITAGGVLLGAGVLAALGLHRARLRFPRLDAALDRIGGYAEVTCAVAAGLLTSWMSLLFAAALNGTPYGFSGMYGDVVRLTAQALRMAETPVSQDAILGTIPSEYPILYPLLIGLGSDATGIPVWQLMGRAELIATSFAVLAGFLMWRRIVSAPQALVIATIVLLVFAQPRKPYEVITIATLLPWAIGTFCDPPRGRLSWWAAGIIGGLTVATYQGFLMHTSIGLAVLFAWSIWRAPDRRTILLRYLGVAAVAFAVAAYYVVPYLRVSLTEGGQRVSDMYRAGSLIENWLPFLDFSPLGMLQLTGVVGAAVCFGTTWWARPLLVLAAGAYAYRLIGSVSFLVSGHSMFGHRAMVAIEVILATAGVLTLVRFGPRLAAALASRAEAVRADVAVRRAGVVLVVAFLAFAGHSYWSANMPSGERNNGTRIAGATSGWVADLSTMAHAEPLPDGSPVRYPTRGWMQGYFPAVPIGDAIRARVGDKPITISFDERLYAFNTFPAYVSPNRTSANTLARWDDRHAELVRLAAVADPAEFARLSRATAFGPVDVFVLKDTGTAWRFEDIEFRPEQFRSPDFDVVHMPNDTVVAIRVS